MSKTIGNVISIDEMLEKFGVDGTRYLLMSAGTFGEDVDVTMERMIEKYNADLANGLGNLVSRVAKLSNSNLDVKERVMDIDISSCFHEIQPDAALNIIWSSIITADNKFIEDTKPWELQKTDEVRFREVMQKLISDLHLISELLIPFMPETSEKIKKALETKKAEILFQRINTKIN